MNQVYRVVTGRKGAQAVSEHAKSRKKGLVIALAAVLALSTGVPVAQAATDTVTDTQDYSATNSAEQAYTQYVFDGTAPALIFSSSDDGSGNPVFPNAYYMGNVGMLTSGTIDWDNAENDNRIYVYDSGAAGTADSGTLTVSTSPAPYASSDEDYLNLHIIGDQSLNAGSLVFDGAGSLTFGSSREGYTDPATGQSYPFPRTQETLKNLILGNNNGTSKSKENDFSGVVDLYDADVHIQNINDTSPNILRFATPGKKTSNSLTNKNLTAEASVAMGSGKGAMLYRMQNISAPLMMIGSGGNVSTKITQTTTQSWTNKNGGSGPWSTTSKSSSTSTTGGTTFDAANGTMTGDAILYAKSVNLYNETVDGNLTLIGGSLFVTPGAPLDITGNYVQEAYSYGNGQSTSGGNLYIPIDAEGNAYGIRTGGNYSISAGNVIVDGETGNYTSGTRYTLLQSALDSGNVFNPSGVYYVYDGSDAAGTIDNLKPYLSSKKNSVDLCLGSSCVAQPSQPKPSQPAPTKTEPTKTQPQKTEPAKSQPTPAKTQPAKTEPAPAPIPVKVKVVTPVQEASHTLTSAPRLTFSEAKQDMEPLVSSGIVGGGPRGLWFKGLGGSQHIGNQSGSNYGIITGYGWSVGPHGQDVAGVAFNAGQSGLGTGPNDYAKASDYGLWGYGTAYFPTQNYWQIWKVSGAFGVGLSSNTVVSTALGLPQEANFGGHFLASEVRASFWDTLPGLDDLIVSPRLSVGYTQSWTNGYETHGGSFLDVHVHHASTGQFFIEPAVLIGKKFNYRTTAGNHTLFPQVRLGLVENIGPTPAATVSSGQVAAQIAGLGYPHTQGMAELRLDVTSHTRYSKGLSGNIAVKQLFGGGASSTEALASIKYRW